MILFKDKNLIFFVSCNNRILQNFILIEHIIDARSEKSLMDNVPEVGHYEGWNYLKLRSIFGQQSLMWRVHSPNYLKYLFR